ncbi:hypothetical protein DPSP01_011603 [Paraphaeosphaeria sporulosa]|uniref:Thioredoxin-like protein n=1 Tax=Paraphaeosphaeria sporulosa TaxID=1460663 RepID=A0A177CDU4_9PLEO|nr:uncharacterized protein CC84DRAFT_1119258 [Paraphaeosphaeria sporulosa]OAG05803.1 hypothetical protein CC84DRAFT_1119258 [Paraphaeosphaeria sporulosa]
MGSPEPANAHALPTPDELQEALSTNVHDREGKTYALGDLTKDKRSVLIFTRHYWCVNCQAYVRAISESIPPSKLPPNTQILIISNGSYQPIDFYARTTSSAYPIYTDPTCRLHAILKFGSGLKEGTEKRDYMQDAGGTVSRIVGGIKGALGNLQHTAYIGPKSLNGGEVIVGADGKCEYMYRMQNTVDHTSIAGLAQIVGVEKASPQQA